MNTQQWLHGSPDYSGISGLVSSQNIALDLLERFKNYFFNWNFLIQVSALFISALIIYLLSRWIKRKLIIYLNSPAKPKKKAAVFFLEFIVINLFPISLSLALHFIGKVFLKLGLWGEIFHFTATLIFAWIIVNILAKLITEPMLAKLISLMIWCAAILMGFDLFEPFVKILDNLAFTVGQLRISLYLVIKSFLVMTLFIWGARYLSTLTEHIIETSETLTPVVKVLISKLIRISFMTIAIVVGMGSLGIDLTAFAVFSGAIGVGIGFGLQKVVSNLISGIILLMDNSLKPGDVIEVGDKYGWIEAMNARYVSIKVWDGTEQLIPNEDMITNKVINWSYTNNLILISVNFGVSYKSDLHLVRKLALDSLQNLERILTEPSAQCYLIEFGDSSVNFKLAFWINDPKNGLANIKSAVLFNLWDIFQANNIEIPFPQRDIHIKRTIIPADTRIN